MADKSFSEIGRIEAIRELFEDSGFAFAENASFQAKGPVVQSGVLMVEGIDFDLTYFPLKHLGYKAVTLAIGDIYAAMAQPVGVSVRIAVSAKLDFPRIKTLWEGMVRAAKQHGVQSMDLDLAPSPNGLYISVSATGQQSAAVVAGRKLAKSMDLICVSGNLGGAYMGLQVLEREKARFLKEKDDVKQPELADYKHLVGEYLKPEINPAYVGLLVEEGIIPSFGYFIDKGLGDALKRLVRDSGLGAKVYVERIPFMSGIFDLGKELNIDPVSAAFNGGDDCRLLFTIPIGSHDKFRHDFQTFDIIGHLAKPDVGAVLVTPDGVELPVRAQGWR